MQINGSGASVQAISTDAGSVVNSNIIYRLQRWLPSGWFPTIIGTRIFATLAGFSAALSNVLAQINYTKLQTRIKTATDGFLDMISWDYFGPTLPRLTNEQDNAFRIRILQNLLRARATRGAMITALTQLTGIPPRIFEPYRVQDTGVYGGPFIGYNVAGGYSNQGIGPYQAFITAYPGASGVTQAQIDATVEAVKPIATEMWVAVGPATLTDSLGNELTDQNGNQLYAQ